MSKITLTNDFHSTSCVVIPKKIVMHSSEHTTIWLTEKQIHSAWKKLCGMKDCTCSNEAGSDQKDISIHEVLNLRV